MVVARSLRIVEGDRKRIIWERTNRFVLELPMTHLEEVAIGNHRMPCAGEDDDRRVVAPAGVQGLVAVVLFVP